MSEMIERVAKALRLDQINFNTRFDKDKVTEDFIKRAIEAGYLNFIPQARAAIEAMREPTKEMMVEAEVAVPSLMCLKDKEQSPSYIAWQAMIDAALK